jgi:hypothetical protein
MDTNDDARQQPFVRPDPGRARAERTYAALYRITERHGPAEAARSVGRTLPILSPHQAVELITSIASGSALPAPGEPEVDVADLAAALTLLPTVRAEVDQLEAGLMQMARGRGMTWSDLAHGLGLGSAQAAQQRYERLRGRTETAGAG